MFNTLKYAKMLEEAGFSREQAETSIKILVEIMEDKLATKQDMFDLRKEMADLKNDVAELRNEMKNDMATKKDLLQLKHDLTVKMGAMISAAVVLVTTLQKLL